MNKTGLFAGACLLSACAFGAAIPLPEHPRPDFERAAWMNLNGTWDFGFEKGKLDRKILVPFGWGSPLSGVKDQGDTGWYRRRVRIPDGWKGRRVFVVVGASDHDTTCVFDGHDLGRHSGGYTPFEYELTDFVKWGEEQPLAFEVWDPSCQAARSGHYLYGKQEYGNVRGIWQTVYLEARADVYVERVAFVPNAADGTVMAHVVLSAPAKAATTCRFALAGKTFDFPVEPGQMAVAGSIKLESPHLWTLEDPYLYDVALTVGEDTVKTYFGLRTVGVGKNPNGDSYVTLNGKPIYLQLCLDQSYHPEGWYTFPSDEFMKNEILIAKRLGLSGNRVHIKAEVPRKLYWADRLGVLIQADVPCAWGEVTEAMFDEHWKCFEGMLKRDFNHPCVYQWTLFNETWGLFSNLSPEAGLAPGALGKKRAYRSGSQRRVAEAYLKAKFLDPTRLVDDNSATVGEDHVVTDVNTWHRYRPGYIWEKTVREWCDGTFPGSRRNYIAGHVQGDEPMMNAECGNVWGYRGGTGDVDFSWDYHMMINAFRRHLKCAGWLYTEHHDVRTEWNGYVRADRSPKYDGMDELAGMTLADFHRDAAIFLAGREGYETGELLAPGQEVTIPVGVSFVTDAYAGKRLSLRRSAWWLKADGSRASRPASACEGTFDARSWQCEKLWDVAFRAPAEPACGCVVFELCADGKPVAKNFWSFGVLPPAPAPLAAAASSWTGGTANVLGGLKLNGFGKGYFEFEIDAPADGGTFVAELSAKRLNGKDVAGGGKRVDLDYIDYVQAGPARDRSKSPNSYPQTSDERHPSSLKVYVGGALAKDLTLADDPADHRGILSWLSQPHDSTLREAGSYGWLVSAPVPASAVRDGKVRVRLEADAGLAVYGPAFGRYPLGPQVVK